MFIISYPVIKRTYPSRLKPGQGEPLKNQKTKDQMLQQGQKMTILEVAKYLRVAPITIQRKLTSGLLKGELRKGRGRGKWFVSMEQVSDYLKNLA